MKQPKLYIKNEKGRYEEYQIPDVDISETLSGGLTESMFLYAEAVWPESNFYYSCGLSVRLCREV